MTVLKKLATKGFLTFTTRGASYVYSAARPAEEVRRELLRNVMDKVFQGSPAALVHSLVQAEELSEEERQELHALIRALDPEEAGDES